MARCAGLKRDGSPCTATVNPPQTYCWWHDPANTEQRKKAASKAGSSKPGPELKDAKLRIKQYVQGVIDGTVEKGRASVAFQGLGVLCRFIEQERKQRELEEVEARLSEIEGLLEQRGNGRRWG